MSTVAARPRPRALSERRSRVRPSDPRTPSTRPPLAGRTLRHHAHYHPPDVTVFAPTGVVKRPVHNRDQQRVVVEMPVEEPPPAAPVVQPTVDGRETEHRCQDLGLKVDAEPLEVAAPVQTREPGPVHRDHQFRREVELLDAHPLSPGAREERTEPAAAEEEEEALRTAGRRRGRRPGRRVAPVHTWRPRLWQQEPGTRRQRTPGATLVFVL